MIPDAVAVITYPGHCVTTLLTIKNLQNLTGWQVPVYLFVDDIGKQYQEWDGDYIEDIREFYDFEFTVIKFSEFEWPYIWDGWLTQQLVKLNVDKFLPGNIWYVTDGDVYVKEPLVHGTTPFNYVPDRNKMIHAQNRSYLDHILKTPNITLEKDNRLLFTHHAPFRWVEKHHLQRLREYVSRIHVNDFNLVHLQLIKEERIIGFGPTAECLSMTEWDLLEVFRSNILQEDIGLEYWPLRIDASIENQAKFWTFYGTDRDIDSQWFKQFGIDVPADIQQKIKRISRT